MLQIRPDRPGPIPHAHEQAISVVVWLLERDDAFAAVVLTHSVPVFARESSDVVDRHFTWGAHPFFLSCTPHPRCTPLISQCAPQLTCTCMNEECTWHIGCAEYYSHRYGFEPVHPKNKAAHPIPPTGDDTIKTYCKSQFTLPKKSKTVSICAKAGSYIATLPQYHFRIYSNFLQFILVS